MNELNNGNRDIRTDLSSLSEEQKNLLNIYDDLREIEKQNALSRFFSNIKSKFAKNKMDIDFKNVGR